MKLTALEHLEKDTKNISSYIILDNSKDVIAKIIIKYGATVKAYISLSSTPYYMGKAGGGGYNRKMAALSKACQQLKDGIKDNVVNRLSDSEGYLIALLIDGYVSGLSIESSLKGKFTVINVI